MKAILNWKEGMKFEAQAGDNTTAMDAKTPIGGGTAMTPKELVAAGLGGCSAMDVVAYLKKMKQELGNLEISVDIATTQKGYPAVFTEALLTYAATGPVDPGVLLEAVHLSQTKYCGVSAMLVKAFPITYKVILNGEEIGTGQADFSAS
jgi:putative redox protein